MVKKILSTALSCVMVFSFMSANIINASAAKSYSDKVSVARVWDGTADTSWYTGNKDSYDIYTAEELAGLNKLCDDVGGSRFEGITINLMNDIVLNDTSDFDEWDENPPKNMWNPIGEHGNFITDSLRPFAGIFNGNGHTISGMYCKDDHGRPFLWYNDESIREGDAGLFRCLSSATILNLRMEKCYADGGSNAGIIAAYGENSCFEMIEIDNCKVIAGGCAGGIMGSAHSWSNTNYLSILTYFTGMAMTGIAINPLLLIGGLKDTSSNATFVIYCKTTDSVIDKKNQAQNTGGFIGGIGLPTGFHGNLLVNTKLCGTPGAMVSGVGVDSNNLIIQQCYQYGTTDISGKKVKTNDSDKVKTVKKSALTGKSLPKKLGSYFKYDKGNEPKIKTIEDTPVDVVLNGKKGTFSWEAVDGAVKYKVMYKNSDGKYATLSTTKKTTTTIKGIKKGKTYQILIRAYFEDGTYETVNSGKFKFKA